MLMWMFGLGRDRQQPQRRRVRSIARLKKKGARERMLRGRRTCLFKVPCFYRPQ
jgi:hypothetical protein